MAEEFSESEVVFSDHHHREEEPKELPQQENSREEEIEKKKKMKVVRSVPVAIPEGTFGRWRSSKEDEDEKEMVPPHLIIGRRIAGKITFSVFTGNGRTLKGRDLCRVRNSVLRLTGFIEV